MNATKKTKRKKATREETQNRIFIFKNEIQKKMKYKTCSIEIVVEGTLREERWWKTRCKKMHLLGFLLFCCF